MTSVNAELFHREQRCEPACSCCGATTATECECPSDDLEALRELVRWQFGKWNLQNVPQHLRGAFLRAFSSKGSANQ